MGVITAWEILLPPKYLREQNNQLEQKLEEFSEQFEMVNPEVERMEKEWNEKQAELIMNYKKDNVNVFNQAQNDNNTIEQKLVNIPSAAQFFSSIKNYLNQNEYQYRIEKYEAVKNEVLGYIDRQDLTSDVKSSLQQYVDNWNLMMVKQYEKNKFSDEQVQIDNSTRL